MRIEADIKLDFKDVLIRPKRSTLRSRSEVPGPGCACVCADGEAPHLPPLRARVR